MTIDHTYDGARAKPSAIGLGLCILLCTYLIAGCASLSSRSGATGMDPDSLSASASALSAENARLRTRLDSQDLDMAKLRAEHQRQTELNEFLQEDNEHLKSELRRVEQQFVTFEQRLRAQETKASAVAATAEAQLMFDKLSADESSPLDSLTFNEVESWLTTGDEMVRKKKYAAAVYYAKRAMRALNQADRRQTLALVDGDTRIIIVSVANLREGPGSDHTVVAKLSYGTVIVQTKVDNDWSEVRTQAGKTGWIHNSLIR